MTSLPHCPKCNSDLTYEDRGLLVCPECSHEWSATTAQTHQPEQARVWKDANGNALNNGDTVMIIKDLKVKGHPTALKSGTKVKNIRLTHGDHDIDCKIDGMGAMQLKSQFVRKV
jgi:protein PhnA